ncbi:helix-turn-helix domain-containing protein [Candidatus Uhrbacteria bacterium]|nr:helix-turn-helix domain-containing protein [Candidatus Uhrbacteria bacterium]MBD3284383.1 helix-turn-helix domain-containing protein [Candidatus Uhrbacteria bacterium]
MLCSSKIIDAMQSNLQTWLESTGLDERRAQIYLTSLSLGEATAGEIAKRMKMNRTAVYDNLRVLEERGYLRTIKHGKRSVFVPLHPKELYKRMDNQKEQLKDLLPDFMALYAEAGQQPFVQLYTGPLAAREIYEDILRTVKEEYLYFSPPELTLQTVDRTYMKQWVERRVKQKIHSRSLRVASKNVKGLPVFTEEANYLRSIRYLPAYVDLKSSIYIYEQSVGIVSTKKEGAAYAIHSPDLAFSLKQLFEFMWSVSMKS